MQNLAIYLVYLAVLLGLGLLLARSKAVSDFLIAGRSNPGFVMGAGIVIGWVDAMWFVLYTMFGLTIGWGMVAWLIPGVVLGFIALSLACGRIKNTSTAANMHTFSDWFYHHYGQKTGVTVGVTVGIAFFCWVTAVFISTGLVISSLFGFDYRLVILSVALLTIPLLLKGGYGSLTRFDVVQFLLVAAMLAIIYAFGFKDGYAVHTPSWDTVWTMGFWGGLSLMLTFFSATFAAADVWQRIYGARDTTQVRRGFLYAMVFAVPAFLSAGLIGMTAGHYGYAGDVNETFAHAYNTFFTPFAQLLFLLLLTSAAISTLNVSIFGTSMSLAKDLMGRDSLDDETLRKRVRIAMIGVIVAAGGMALATQDILTLAMTVFSASNCVTGLLALNLLGVSIRPAAAFASVLLALAVFIGQIVTGTMTPELSAVPLAVNLASVLAFEYGARLRR